MLYFGDILSFKVIQGISMSEQTSSMWGGRFSEATDSFVAEFTASVNFDKRMARQDIQGSIAHATMLGMCGIITQDESCQIINGLTQIQAEIDDGKFQWSVVLEDVHMNIESRLTTLIGDVGKNCTLVAAAMTKLLQTFAYGCVMRRIIFWCCLPNYKVDFWIWQPTTLRPSCPALPIFRPLSLSALGIMSWHGLKCLCVTANAL